MKHIPCYLIGSLALLALPGACSDGKQDAGREEETVETLLLESSTEVDTMTLRRTTFYHELVSNGKLAASHYADLRFESAEPIAAIRVKNGDRVTKGQVLAELTVFRLNNRTAQAKDALDRAKLDMQDVLIGQGFSPEDSLKTPPAILQLAQTRSGYDQALAQYRLAVYEEEKATLKAPFDGVVANLFAKPYNMASVSETFCTLLDARHAEASFTVMESELPLVRVGDRVEIEPFFQTNNQTIWGAIAEINPLVDANGMVRIKALTDNPGHLFEGMNIRVKVQRSAPDMLVVPKTAVVIRSGKQVVFTLVDGKSYWNYVQTGLENMQEYIVTEGLTEGSVIITSGNINLAHESTVSVKK
ncbi:MAG: efflux RND transporter periplasmic adaptor subunit [Tannerellaceae bacterium]|nr:efflux RND transporter periplasmic adaptor subunit [Tannerellaceae bacterium]